MPMTKSALAEAAQLNGSLSLGGSERTLAERAFGALRQAIVTGRIRPGERLLIEELAVYLDMSPMPIREAIRHLHAVGLAENIPHRGARVTELSLTDLQEVYEARVMLEPLAVRRAAERFSKADAKEAAARLAALNAAPDVNSAETMALHTAFHFALYNAARSKWLNRLIQPLWETSSRYRVAAPHTRRLATRRMEHQAILQACIDHDPDRAAGILFWHLAAYANLLAKNMGSVALFKAPAASAAAVKATASRSRGRN
jgi:DNA-binding GntR family transcriptional regulator